MHLKRGDLMEIGISSSCFFPLETEKSFLKLAEMGAKTAEIFFNSEIELSGKIFETIKKVKEDNGITIRSIHPFTSYAEPFILFGSYKRRITEGIEYYKQYFEAAEKLGAECVVLHGGNKGKHNDEDYFESFRMLCDAAKPYGVLPVHEIVNRRSASDIEFLKKLQKEFEDEFKIVLDTKQCRRCGVDEFEIINTFPNDIMQVHISDFDETRDCIPPGEGKYDFKKLFDSLQAVGYDKSAIIELYNWGYSDEIQIKNSKVYLDNLISK